MNKLRHTIIQVAVTGDNATSSLNRLTDLLNEGWQIVSAVAAESTITYILLSPHEQPEDTQEGK